MQILLEQEILTQTPAPVETVVKTPPPKGTSLLQDPSATTLDATTSPQVEEFIRESEVLSRPPAVEPTIESRVAEFQVPDKKLADMLKNPEVRTRYDELVPLTEGLKTEAGTSLQLTPSSQLPGVQEFTSFKEAFQAGDNLLSGAGNVAERFMTYDLGELTKGKLTGFIGSRGAYNTATVAARTFAGPEEVSMPAGRNLYSAAISAGLAEQGATTAYQPQTVAMDFSNQMATGNVTNPFTTLNNIRQKAGFGNIYGSLNSVAGIVS